MPRTLRRVLLPLLLLIAALPLCADEVRPLSELERSAVADMAQYVAHGPQAVWDELSSRSPIREYGHDAALQEIETRLGPRGAGTTWELQSVVPALKDKTAVFTVGFPSGIDDNAIIEFTQENGKYKIDSIRILAEPSPVVPFFPPLPPDSETQSFASRLYQDMTPAVLALGLFAMLLCAGGALLWAEYRDYSTTMTWGAILLVIVGFGLAIARDPQFNFKAPVTQASVVETEKGPLRLAGFLPYRRALATATNADAEYQRLHTKGTAHDVAELWKAQNDLQQQKTLAVTNTLSHFPQPSTMPLAEILRARLASYDAKEVDTVVGYEQAVNLGPGRDGLFVEAAESLDNLGYKDRAENYLRRLSRSGSREATVYYEQAFQAAVKQKDDEAVDALLKGWNLKPMERGDLIRTPAFWSVLRKPKINETIKLSTASEAAFFAPDTSSRAITVPPEMMTRVSGSYFEMTMGQQTLGVPGGAALAPVGTPVVDAGEWSRAEEQKGLADVAQLAATAHQSGAFTQPSFRKRMERCAEALAKHNRWVELVQLTEGLSPKSENIPTDLFFMRFVGLQRVQRLEDAKALLANLAVSRTIQRKSDWKLMEQIGEMFASVDLYDAAIKMLEKSNAARRNPMLDERMRSISMKKRLAEKYQTLRTEHFEIHYPEDASQLFAQKGADILEAELRRLQKYVSVPNFHPVVVNFVWWDEFSSTYTGSDYILGIYEGKITLPVVGVTSFVPEVVAVMSHELLHAMLAQATNDQAPHWFHEGLAQRVEMVPYQRNAFNMYDDDRLLSISLIDDIITGSPDPDMIGEAYIESQTIMRFVETTYGLKGIQQLVESFRDGATTDEAIAKLAGTSVADFDVKLRAWGRSAGKQVFENHNIVVYDDSEQQFGKSPNNEPLLTLPGYQAPRRTP